MKIILFALLLLLSVIVPTAEWAGTATTNLSVNIQPVGVVAPPPQAVAAGMTTMALYNDFTSPIPNTVGTGLPSNTAGGGNCYGGSGCWLGCNNPSGYGTGDNFPHVWYAPAPDLGFTAPCNGTDPQSYVRQVTDPTYGNLALKLAGGTNRQNSQYDSYTTMSTYVRDPTDPSTQNLFSDYPMSNLTRVTWRSNSNVGANAGAGSYPNGPIVDFWKWTAAWYAENIASYCTNHGGCSPLQIDDIEDWGANNGWGSLHNWHCNTSDCASGVGGGNPGYDQTKYTTLDTLTTTNGTSDIKTCTWLTNPDTTTPTFKGCASFPRLDLVGPPGSQADNSGTYATRNVLVWWIGTWSNWTPPELPIYALIKTYQVWSCADWKRGSTGPNPYCFGQSTLTTAADGSQFYKIVTQ